MRANHIGIADDGSKASPEAEPELLLSIVIATRNRIPYCINSIHTILKYSDPTFELVVQDNSDSFELRDYLHANINDIRLKYAYTPPPFSSTDNFNAALEMAKGEYICLIGDDDAVCPNIFEVVKWAQVNDIDSICPKHFLDYYWPDAFGPASIGYLAIPRISKTFRAFDPKEAIGLLLADGLNDYMKFEFPKLYHGLIRRSCLESVRQQTGHFIGGLSPDIYAAVSLAFTVKSHVVIGFPISISGACNLSTTVAGQTGGHSGELKNAPHFRARTNYEWNHHIPYYYSVQTIWAESALKALNEMGIEVDPKDINLPRLVAGSVISTPGHFNFFIKCSLQCINHSRQNPISFLWKTLFRFFTIFLSVYYLKIINRIINKLKGGSIKIIHLDTIEEAVSNCISFINELETRKHLDAFIRAKHE